MKFLLRFCAKQLEALRKEMFESLRIERQDDDSIVGLFFQQAIYGSHPLGQPVAGRFDTLKHIDINMVQQYHQTHYYPAHKLWLFAGDITLEDVERVFTANLTPSAMELNTIESPAIPIATNPTRQRLILVNRPNSTQAQIRIGQLSRIDGFSPQAQALWLATTAFSGMFTAPFSLELREKRGWSYIAHGSFPHRARTNIPWVLFSAPAIKDTADCIELQLHMLHQLSHEPQPLTRIQAAHQFLQHQEPLKLSDPMGRIIRVIENKLLGVDNEHLLHGVRPLSDMDPLEAQHILMHHLKDNHWVIAVVGDAKQLEPQLALRFPHIDIECVDYQQIDILNTARLT